MESRDLDILISIDNKIDSVKDKIHSIEVTQTKMESDLKYHIKRTDLLEEKIFDMDEKMKPVETAKYATGGFFKLMALLGGIITAIIALMKTIKN